MTRDDEQLNHLLRSYEAGGLSRRDVLKRAGVLGIGATSLGTFLAACGGDDGGGAATGGAPVTDATPKPGGILIEGYDRPFSPITTVNAAWVDPTHDAMLEALLTTDADGKIVPKLAESWEMSADAQTWTFKLREGLMFHSGKPVTAKDVVADLNLDRGDTAQHPYWYTQVTSIKEGPDNTIVVKCNKPFATLGDLYRQQFANIYDPAAAKKAGKAYGTKVVAGTGPFKLTNFVATQEVTAERFEEYGGTSVPYFENPGKAYLDGIKWVPIAEQANRTSEIVSGNVHVIKNPLPTDLEQLKANQDLIVEEMQEAGGVILGLNFEKTDLGFDDLRVRQAISHAIDRESIVKAVLFDLGSPLYGPFPSDYKWYETGVEQFNQFDTAKAESLLDEAGWTKGGDGVRAKGGKPLSFTVFNQTDTVRNQVGDAVSQMLQKIGVRMKMSNLEPAAYFQELGSSPDAYFFPWLWLDFPRITQVTQDSRFIPAPNWAHASVPEVDAAIDKWTFAADDADMEAAAREIQLAAAEHVPAVSLYSPKVVWVHRKELHGFRPTNPNNLYPYYNDMWLES